MNIKKNFFSRIARLKGAAQAESKEEYEIPPPTAIEAGVPHATENSGDKGLGSHQELELISSGELAPTGSANSVDPVNGGDAPTLEALVEPATDESPDASGLPREAEPYEEYGIDLESLTETESSHDDEVASSGAADNVAEAPASEAGMTQETEPEAMDEIARGVEEPVASITDNAPDEAVLSQDTRPDEGYGDDFEALAAPVLDESADAPEPVHEEADSEIAESAAQAAAPEPEISNEPTEDIKEEVGEPLAAVVMQGSPDESLEPALAENGIFPLVRDTRGDWRPGKGFSRGELREAGLSLADASRLHIRFDKRRRNTHPVNVASLEQAKSDV